MSQPANGVGETFAIAGTFGAAMWEWLFGNGFWTAPTMIAVLSLAVGFLSRYDKICENAPRLWGHVRLAYRSIRGKL